MRTYSATLKSHFTQQGRLPRKHQRAAVTLPGVPAQAAWPLGYWVRNMNQECYTGVHESLYLPIGIVAVIVFCLAPPVAAFVIMWRLRRSLKVAACIAHFLRARGRALECMPAACAMACTSRACTRLPLVGASDSPACASMHACSHTLRLLTL